MSWSEVHVVEAHNLVVDFEDLSEHVEEFDSFWIFVQTEGLSSLHDEVSTIFVPFAVPFFLLDFVSLDLDEIVGVLDGSKMLFSNEFISTFFTLLDSLGSLALIGDLSDHVEVKSASCKSLLLNCA